MRRLRRVIQRLQGNKKSAKVLLASVAIVCFAAFSQTSHATGILDTVILNADTNVNPPDEDPGLTIFASFLTSTPLQCCGGPDTVEDAFGNNDGAIEGNSFIFDDGGVVDNGNMIIGDGGELVDFIEWSTSSPIELGGLQIQLQSDGVGARSVELVRILVENVEVGLYDNNGAQGSPDFNFAPAIGNDFRVEFTRTGSSGPRIARIDALDARVVPEPTTLVMLMSSMACAVLAVRRRSEAF